MTRNVLGLSRNNTSWADGTQPVGSVYELSRQSCLVATRKTLNVWANSYQGEDLDRMKDFLDLVPFCSEKEPEEAEFSCGTSPSADDPTPQEIIHSTEWISKLHVKEPGPQPNVGAAAEWTRIFGPMMPFVSRIDLVDPYLPNDIDREQRVLEEIVALAFTQFSGKLVLHFRSPSEVKNSKTEEAIIRYLSRVRDALSTVSQRRFEVKIHKSQQSGRATIEKVRDRHLHFSFSDSSPGLLYVLGHGLDTFDPLHFEGSLGIGASGSWPPLLEQLNRLSDEPVTRRIMEAVTRGG